MENGWESSRTDSRIFLTLSSAYGIVRHKMRKEKEIEMTYKECLEICKKRMCVMGYFPDEIEAAAKEMYFRRNGLLEVKEIKE